MTTQFTVTLSDITWGDPIGDDRGPIHPGDLPGQFRHVARTDSEDVAIDEAIDAARNATGYEFLECGSTFVD